MPGQKQTVDVIFTPTHEKVISQNLQFKCRENSKIFTLAVKGQGINYALDIIESSVEMGPVLPYDKSAAKTIEIRNPMSFAIEVYSADFDKQYLDEEEILKRFEPINEKGDTIFEKLRKAGQDFWPNIKDAVDKKKQYDDMLARVKAIQDQIDKECTVPAPEEGKEPKVLSDDKKELKTRLDAEKAEIEAKILEIDTANHVTKKTIAKVKKRDRLSIVLFGPEK